MKALRSLIANDVTGEPIHIESFLGYDLKGPFGACVVADCNHWVRRLPGQLLHNILDHLLSKIIEFLPNGSFRLHACSWQKAQGFSEGHAELPDELRVMVVGTGISAYATFSCHARPLQHFLTFYGTRNTAHLDFSSGTLTLSPTTLLPGALGRLSRSFDNSWQHFREAGSFATPK